MRSSALELGFREPCTSRQMTSRGSYIVATSSAIVDTRGIVCSPRGGGGVRPRACVGWVKELWGVVVVVVLGAGWAWQWCSLSSGSATTYRDNKRTCVCVSAQLAIPKCKHSKECRRKPVQIVPDLFVASLKYVVFDFALSLNMATLMHCTYRGLCYLGNEMITTDSCELKFKQHRYHLKVIECFSVETRLCIPCCFVCVCV